MIPAVLVLGDLAFVAGLVFAVIIAIVVVGRVLARIVEDDE